MSEHVLITGGNGFLAGYIIQQLLTAGHTVRATLRSLDKAADVTATLTARDTPHLDRLSFVTADLTQDAGWSAAMAGVTTVMSVAAPVFVDGRSVSTTVEQAAQVGTLRILKAAKAAGVHRVVMTANLGAVGFSHLADQTPVTETDWTDPAQPGLSLYEKSKLVAEQAAWTYAQSAGLDLVTVNAGAMLGPAFGSHVSGSFNLVRRVLTGQAMPNLVVNVVDVRDVARLHVLAMTIPQAANQRFLAVAPQSVSVKEMRTLIRAQRPGAATHLARYLVPTAMVRLLAPVVPALKEADLMMRLNHNVSTAQAQTILGWTPQYDQQTAVLAAVDSLQALTE